MNWKWPQTWDNNRAPWYAVLRRLPMIPFVCLGLGLLVIATYVGWGRCQANHIYHDICG